MGSFFSVSRKNINKEISSTIENNDIALYMPNFYCSNLTYYAKITTDPVVYKDNCNYNGISFLIPYPSKTGDYVALKESKFSKNSKIYKIHKIINHEVVLLNFNEKPIDKIIFEKRIEEYKSKEKAYEYYDRSRDGGSRHMNKPMHVLYETYGKDIQYMTIEEILHEKEMINNIKIKNL
jgi:hypothetical protein